MNVLLVFLWITLCNSGLEKIAIKYFLFIFEPVDGRSGSKPILNLADSESPEFRITFYEPEPLNRLQELGSKSGCQLSSKS